MSVFGFLKSICIFLIFVSCNPSQDPEVSTDSSSSNESGNSTPETRSFYMGYTTWDFGYANRSSGQSSQNYMYEKVKDSYYVDIGALHYMEGMPWGVGHDAYYPPEALDSVSAYSGYHNGLSAYDAKAYILNKVTATAPLKVLYLAIDPTNDKRNAITKKLGHSSNSYSPASGDDGSLHMDEIHYAYTNYAIYTLWLVYKYYTDNSYPLPQVYFNYASEGSDLVISGNGGSQTRWNNFEVFSKRFVTFMKSYAHASDTSFTNFVGTLKYMFSIVLRSPGSSDMTTLTNAIADSDNSMGGEKITDYTDLIGISTYGYLFYDDQWGGVVSGTSTVGNDKLVIDNKRANPNELPSNWLSQVKDIAPGEDYGITETGWIGEDLLRPAMLALDGNETVKTDYDDYLLTSNADYQDTYTQMVFKESNEMNFKFLIFFTYADYDISTNYFETNPPFGDPKQDQDFLNIFNAWVKTGFFQPRDSMDTYSEYLNFSGSLSDGLVERSSWGTWKDWFARAKN